MLKSGIADVYRNEQFLPKPDVLYNFELLLIHCNLNSTNKERVKRDISIALLYLMIILRNSYFKLN